MAHDYIYKKKKLILHASVYPLSHALKNKIETIA